MIVKRTLKWLRIALIYRYWILIRNFRQVYYIFDRVIFIFANQFKASEKANTIPTNFLEIQNLNIENSNYYY